MSGNEPKDKNHADNLAEFSKRDLAISSSYLYIQTNALSSVLLLVYHNREVLFSADQCMQVFLLEIAI